MCNGRFADTFSVLFFIPRYRTFSNRLQNQNGTDSEDASRICSILYAESDEHIRFPCRWSLKNSSFYLCKLPMFFSCQSFWVIFFYNLLLPISLVPKSNDVVNIQFLIPISNDVSKRQCVQFTWSPIFRSTESVHLFGHLFNWQDTSVHPEKHLHIFILNKSDSKCLHDSIVVSIPACHAGDRGSIPRRGAFFYLIFQKQIIGP